MSEKVRRKKNNERSIPGLRTLHGDEGERYATHTLISFYFIFAAYANFFRTQTAYTFNLLASRYAVFSELSNGQKKFKKNVYIETDGSIWTRSFCFFFSYTRFLLNLLRLNNKSVEANMKSKKKFVVLWHSHYVCVWIGFFSLHVLSIPIVKNIPFTWAYQRRALSPDFIYSFNSDSNGAQKHRKKR